MDKTLKRLNLLMWMGVPLGLIMYVGTEEAFGFEMAMPLSIIAATSFALIVRKGKERIISEALAKEIREAINRFGRIENYIEIKSGKRIGLIARIYLINAGSRAGEINQVVRNRLETSVFKGKIWILQLTDMASKEELRATRQALDIQLVEELKKMAEDERNKRK